MFAVEVCVGSLDDAVLAFSCGADRVELNSCLELGGISPSLATCYRASLASRDRDLISHVRPRPGGFQYTDAEFECMLDDGARFLDEGGANGLIFGFLLHSAGQTAVDLERTRQMAHLCARRQAVAVFSRAFDVLRADLCPNALRGLQRAGIARVLTSGGASSCLEGADRLLQWAALSDRPALLPGAGVRQHNLDAVLLRLFPKTTAPAFAALHGSFRTERAHIDATCGPFADDPQIAGLDRSVLERVLLKVKAN